MSISLDELQAQLAATEAELERAKSHTHRCDGAIQLLKHFIEEAKKNLQKQVE